MSELEAGDARGIYEQAIQPGLEQHTSRIFEDVCREYLRRQNREGLLPFRYTTIGRWWSKGVEIDIVATDPGRANFLIGECKFTNSPLSQSEMDAVLTEFVPDRKTASVHYFLFSRGGFTDGVRKSAKECGVRLIGLDEML